MPDRSNSYVFAPRILRSHRSDCWGNELESALEAYSDAWLSDLAAAGYDAIWVRLDLHETVPSRLFPKVGPEPLDRLNRLVARAARHGVRVFVYLNEPKPLRAADPFWKAHPDLKGLPGKVQSVLPQFNGSFIRLCTSQPAVRAFLEESAAALFRQTPGLGGAFLINASETFTHCYSHYFPKPTPARAAIKVNWQINAPLEIVQKAAALAAEQRAAWDRGMTCPRCIRRDQVEVTAEVIAALERGIHAAAPRVPVIVWTWSWSGVEPDPQPGLIARLPKRVILMSDWERGGFKEVLGRTCYVDEYSFSSLGPSPRFLAQARLARRRGLRVMAKLMMGATHELAAVPYLPLYPLLAEKMARLRRAGVSGFLGCWNFGGDLNPMSRLGGRLSRAPVLTPDRALRWLARTVFGARRPAALLAAWRHVARAWREYPFSMPLIYTGPMNYAPAFPFSLRRTRRRMPSNWLKLPRDRRGHIVAGFDPDRWLRFSNTERRFQMFGAPSPAPFDGAVVTAAFEKMLVEWRRGLAAYRAALAANPGSEALRREYRLACHIGHCLQATVHLIRFHTEAWALPAVRGAAARRRARARLRRIVVAERRLVEADRALVARDPDLGYHPEAHVRLYTEADLDVKRAQLDQLLRTLQ